MKIFKNRKKDLKMRLILYRWQTFSGFKFKKNPTFR